MFAIEVNGNRVHDEGEHEPGEAKVVKRQGGGDLTFATEEEAEAVADALYERHVAEWTARGLRRHPATREAYRVVPLPPAPGFSQRRR